MSKNQRQQHQKPATKVPHLREMIQKLKSERLRSKQSSDTASYRCLSVIEMQKLFDETAEANMERRWAIADCMGISLAQAIKESEQRNVSRHSSTGKPGPA